MTNRTEHQSPTSLNNPQEGEQRPCDMLGPPSDPLSIDEPCSVIGCKKRILCYHPDEGITRHYDNVLLRDESATGQWDRVQHAYLPVPNRAKTVTKSGWVEICHVLKRRRNQEGDQTGLSEEDERNVGLLRFEMTTEHVAAKITTLRKLKKIRQRGEKEDPLREMAIMQHLGNDMAHVSTCREILFDATSNSYNAILPFFQGGDLLDHLDSEQNIGEDAARPLFRDIMQGLRNLHDKGICHHDLSPENIVIHNSQAFIIDFGMALRVPYNEKQRCLVKKQGTYGKLRYMSQEIYSNKDFDSEAIDVWSAGTILWCMVTGYCSYQVPRRTDGLFYHFTTPGYFPKLLKSYGCELSPTCVGLLENMLRADPRERFSIDEVLQHSWLRDPSLDLSA